MMQERSRLLLVHDKSRYDDFKRERNAFGNNVGVYETVAIATPANPGAFEASLEKSRSPMKLFLSASISWNEHFPARSEWRRSLSTEKSVSSRRPRYRGEGGSGDSFRGPLLRARCVFAHSLASDERPNSFRDEILHRSAPCRTFARRCAYASADASGNG